MEQIILIDTHTHLYLPEYNNDRIEVIQNALEKGIHRMLLPNIDSSSIYDMNLLAGQFPDNCFAMMGLHPVSVKEDYRDELDRVKSELEAASYIGIGESGIDLYRDTSFREQQCIAFEEHVKLSLRYGLPLVIHARNSFHEIFEILERYRGQPLKGVFHAFTGDIALAERVIDIGFKLGIGGILTFKKSGLDEVVRQIDLSHIVLETDSPYLAPVPKRGKRNESGYLLYTAEFLANIKEIPFKEVAEITTNNALSVFNRLPYGQINKQ